MPSRSKSRVQPSSKTLSNRKRRLENLANISPLEPTETSYQLELGNSKIGYKSEHFGAVFAWNIPPAATCPGRSSWCVANCYNGDDRPETYDLQTWRKNWWGIVNEPEVVKLNLVEQLNQNTEPTAVRIHSSGDFFSVSYIDFWCDLVDRCKGSTFWAYTRSWTNVQLLEQLEVLQSKSNVQLFASWDDTMPDPPVHWRASFVEKKLSSRKQTVLDCPEQYDLSQEVTCATCRHCLLEKSGDVYFVLH